VSSRYLTLLGVANDLGRDRLGIIASRRVGDAVTRNRAKRRLREIFRRGEPDVIAPGTPSLDIVAIARRELASAPFADVRADFHAGLRKLKGLFR
jgi:ribonuclease P protein component